MATSKPSDQIRATALIVSVPREVEHDSVTFEENGKVVAEAKEEWLDNVADAQREATRADVKLNRVYGQLIAALGPTEKKQLAAVERAWIAYRDSESEFVSQSRQIGSASTQALYLANCIKSLTEDRIKQLQADLEDMSPK